MAARKRQGRRRPARTASRKTARRAARGTRSKVAKRAPSRPSGRKSARTSARRGKKRANARKTGLKSKPQGARRSAAQARAAARKVPRKPRMAPRPAAATRKPVPSAPVRTSASGQPGGTTRTQPVAPRSKPKAEAVVRPKALERERRRLSDDEREEGAAARVGADDAQMRAARSGHDGLRGEILKHTETSPKLTSGDVDARWQDAYAIGDEAPGGDNPTPDQDRVDDIGRALGITYQDNQELEGGDEVASRDRHRWELDPASAEDWPHDEDRRKREEEEEE